MIKRKEQAEREGRGMVRSPSIVFRLGSINGNGLVDYADEEDTGDGPATSPSDLRSSLAEPGGFIISCPPSTPTDAKQAIHSSSSPPASAVEITPAPISRADEAPSSTTSDLFPDLLKLGEKRRREAEAEDLLDALSSKSRKESTAASPGSKSSPRAAFKPSGPAKSFLAGGPAEGGKKLKIAFAPKSGSRKAD